MNLRTIDPVSDPGWATFVSTASTEVFSSPNWLRVVRDSYPFHVRAIVGYDAGDGVPLIGIPYAEIDDLRGHRLVVFPFSDYCDGVVGEPKQWQALVDELVRPQAQVMMKCLRNEFPKADDRFVQSGSAAWHALDLTQGADATWSTLPSTARTAVRRAEKADLQPRHVSDREGLRAFFDLHLRNRKYKYGLLAQPYRFFESLWENFIEAGMGSLIGAYQGDELLAGVLLLKWQDRVYYKYNASSPDHLSLRPNDLLMWESIRWGIEAGCATLDLGLSALDQPGLVKYKEKWSSESHQICSYRYTPQGPSSAEQQTWPMLNQLTDLLTRDDVPDALTERAGEAMYRLFA